MTLVVDASVVVSLWIDPDAAELLPAHVIGHDLHAPDHLLVESVNVLRRRFNAGLLSAAEARAAFAGVQRAPVQLWPFASVAERVWQLGSNVSSYDGAYVALAERLGSPLLTRDRRLAHAPGIRCPVTLV